jgi:hypothetical protein
MSDRRDRSIASDTRDAAGRHEEHQRESAAAARTKREIADMDFEDRRRLEQRRRESERRAKSR